MKKLLFAIMAGALITASCVSEIRETVQTTGAVLSLTASTEQPAGTRTMVAVAGEVFWEKGDEIKVSHVLRYRKTLIKAMNLPAVITSVQ